MSEYRSQIGRFLGDLQSAAKNYMPTDFDYSIFNSDASDQMMYLAARQLRAETEMRMSATNHKKSEAPAAGNNHYNMTYIVPHRQYDGSVTYYDKLHGEHIAGIYKQPDGLFSYYGPRDFITMLGGRGDLGQVIKMMEDGDLFRDGVKK